MQYKLIYVNVYYLIMLHNILCIFDMYLIYNIYCYNMFFIIKITLNKTN